MNGNDLYSKLSDIDLELIQEAGEYGRFVTYSESGKSDEADKAGEYSRHYKSGRYSRHDEHKNIVSLAGRFIAVAAGIFVIIGGLHVYRNGWNFIMPWNSNIEHAGNTEGDVDLQITSDSADEGNVNDNIKSDQKQGFFTIKVYASENNDSQSSFEKNNNFSDTVGENAGLTEHTLAENEIICLGRENSYSVLSSAVPGFCLEASYDGEYDKIIYTTNNGNLIQKKAESQIKNMGSKAEYSKEDNNNGNEEIYWSPLTNDGIIQQTNITIKVMKDETVIKECTLYIYSDTEGTYYGKML